MYIITMEEKRKKLTYLLYLTAFTLVVGVIGALLLLYGWPGTYFAAYPFIPIYFYIFGFILIQMFERIKKNIQSKTLLLYVSIRMMKLLISVIVLAIYGLVLHSQIKEFMFTFVVFYLLFLVFDTCFFFKVEVNEIKRLQEQKKKNENL